MPLATYLTLCLSSYIATTREELMNEPLTEVTEGEWDARIHAGTARIQKRWEHLSPRTKEVLMQDGFDSRGRRSAPIETGDESDTLAYALGLFEEAVKASIPMQKGDFVPSYFPGDEILHEAANLVFHRKYCDPEFTELALHACMKHQAASSTVSLYLNGGKSAGAKSSIAKAIAGIFFAILLAVSIGNGITLALEHDAASSSVLAFLAMFSYSMVKRFDQPTTISKWEVAYSNWMNILLRDFHIGTAHGVEQQLQQFLRQNVHVPSVLFDLCAVLQQGTRYEHATGGNA
jgi:hypothetical protein